MKVRGRRLFDNQDLLYTLGDVACLYGRWVDVLSESDLARSFHFVYEKAAA